MEIRNGRLQRHPWDIPRWRLSGSRRQLSVPARYAYRELCDEVFAEGSIPDDAEQCAVICGMTVAEFTPLWGELRPRFRRVREGRLRNREAYIARTYVLKKSQVRSEIATLAATERWRRSPAESQSSMHRAMLQAMPEALHARSVSVSSCLSTKPEEQEKTSTRARAADGFDAEPGWAWFSGNGGDAVAPYPHIRDMDAAARAWVSVVTCQQIEDEIRLALADDGPWRRSEQWSRGVFDDAANWLLRKLWRGRPAPLKAEPQTTRASAAREAVKNWRPDSA